MQQSWIRSDIWNVSFIELRIWNQVSDDHRSYERNLRVQTPLKSWFFQASIRLNCLNCVHNCDDHSLRDLFKIDISFFNGRPNNENSGPYWDAMKSAIPTLNRPSNMVRMNIFLPKHVQEPTYRRNLTRNLVPFVCQRKTIVLITVVYYPLAHECKRLESRFAAGVLLGSGELTSPKYPVPRNNGECNPHFFLKPS